MTIEERGYEAKLSKNESLVFEFIMQEKERACFLTSTDIAKGHIFKISNRKSRLH